MRCRAHKVFSAAGALTLAVTLAGCGGDSASSGSGAVAVASAPAPAPAPSPAPTPTPSPSPTPAPLAGPAALTQGQDFAVLGYSVTGTTARDGSGPTSQQPGGVAFRYVASQARHEIQIPGRDWGVLGVPIVSGANFSTQRVTVGTGASAFVYDLRLFVPGDRNQALPLTYTSYGSWAASAIRESDPTKIDQNFGSFAYGVPTPATGVPRTGTAQYRGIVFDSYDTAGVALLSIDFGTGRVSGSIEPLFNDGIGGIGPGGTYPVSGSIQPGVAAFQVNFQIGSTGRSGLLEVQFTGPHAEELMFRWGASIQVPHLTVDPVAYILPGVARRT